MAGRFDYVRYNDASAENQRAFKAMFEEIEKHAVASLMPGRAQSLVLTKLEEAYMWVGKAIRDEQIARGGDATDQPARGEAPASSVVPMPKVGEIVIYKLTEADAEAIARRRTTGAAIADRIKADRWPLGAQAHVGDPNLINQELPMIVCARRVDMNGDFVAIDGQVFLCGNDVLWVTSVRHGDAPGHWHRGE